MEQRFIKKIQKTETCWLWTDTLYDGYGYFRIGLKKYRSHRVSYEMWVNPIPDGLIIRHKCDNRNCVNPDHLEVGTRQDNSNDMVQRDRSYKVRGTAHHNSKLTDDDIIEIKILNGFNFSQSEIASRFNVTKSSIGNALKDIPHEKYDQSGTNNPNSKLTYDDANEIRILYGFGFSQTYLASQYGVKQGQISRVIRR